jgi:hypothetical protein
VSIGGRTSRKLPFSRERPDHQRSVVARLHARPSGRSGRWPDAAGATDRADEKETCGFDIRRQSAADGRVSFSITPGSLFVRPIVAPLTVTFDSATRNVVRCEGRVPPMRSENGKLDALDARVDYPMNVPVYR